jgi:hypothetical protein
MVDLGSIDLESDGAAAPVPTDEKIAAISKLAVEYDLLQKDLKILEERTRIRKERCLQIEREAMPLAMENAGVKAFVASNGRSIKIDEIVSGSIPAKSTIDKAKGDEKQTLITRREAAYAVINEKWPGLVKTELSVSFGKGEAEVALRMAKLISDQFQRTAAIDTSVHPGTLNSHFKELKEQGKLGEIPVEPFDLYIGPIAKIK